MFIKSSRPLVIVLLGPTASGKTSLAIELGQLFNLSIHNIDSRQLYKGMDIGTAKPSQEQLKTVNVFLFVVDQYVSFKKGPTNHFQGKLDYWV